MRQLVSHKVNGCNEELEVTAIDQPGHGNACHEYLISAPANPGKSDGVYCSVKFQNGGIALVGTNGVTHEALLAILQDRLEGFQSGPFACADNQEALDAIKKAQECLQRRTKARLARGVEGTHTV